VSDLINEPLQSFEGKLIAVVHRADDNEEKWVATTENETFSAAEIAARIHFMEQYFDSTVRLI
ncbi:MAG: inorganic pyrophosphatase, partial [Lacticaseibacillus paracasei]|nr:inorganic pyrophosphatase [Lacticaseibacillus paracasei]